MKINITKEKVIAVGFKAVDATAMSEEDRAIFFKAKKSYRDEVGWLNRTRDSGAD